MTLLADLVDARKALDREDPEQAALLLRMATESALMLAADHVRRVYGFGTGANDIHRERLEHCHKGFDSRHDLRHSFCELAYAALFQLDSALGECVMLKPSRPPFGSSQFAEKARRRDMRAAFVVAGSLCAAAIDRFDVEASTDAEHPSR